MIWERMYGKINEKTLWYDEQWLKIRACIYKHVYKCNRHSLDLCDYILKIWIDQKGLFDPKWYFKLKKDITDSSEPNKQLYS